MLTQLLQNAVAHTSLPSHSISRTQRVNHLKKRTRFIPAPAIPATDRRPLIEGHEGRFVYIVTAVNLLKPRTLLWRPAEMPAMARRCIPAAFN